MVFSTTKNIISKSGLNRDLFDETYYGICDLVNFPRALKDATVDHSVQLFQHISVCITDVFTFFTCSSSGFQLIINKKNKKRLSFHDEQILCFQFYFYLRAVFTLTVR